MANLRAASYHAGKPMEQRLSVQRDFAAGKVRMNDPLSSRPPCLLTSNSLCRASLVCPKLCDTQVRVVVATVAFGMGVDMSCLGAVIHLTMPRSLEDYVQQVWGVVEVWGVWI